jgi:flagellar export protein FliJ
VKKYAFRLETVRRVRRTQEDQAKAELLRANNAVTSANREVSDKSDAYESSMEGASQRSVASLDAFMARRYFTELSNLALVAAKASLAAAQIEADAAKSLWSDKAKEVKALDRLDERSREAYMIEMQRLETAEADDMTNGRWVRDSNKRIGV